ncbi:zinc-ribbon domain-containing protein [Escherichia coli]|nr:zinc-ribbon domain-containing protein [Escherichia coli]MCV1765658.1 zinc-ribbon domain-containing protein [Escherichia coli]
MRLTCALLNPPLSPSPLHSRVASLSPLSVAQSWYCVLCERHYQGEKFCTSCGSGIYSTEEPLRQELSPESENG